MILKTNGQSFRNFKLEVADSMNEDILSRLKQVIKEFDFTNSSVIGIKTPLTIQQYNDWLNNGYHAGMKYLKDHADIKENPNLKWPGAKSIIVLSQNYFPHPSPTPAMANVRHLKIAKYARGSDYHHWFLQKLSTLAIKLKESFPAEEFWAHTDSSPLLERNWAFEAGLGWFGKNSCIINQNYGSFHFLGEIVTTTSIHQKIEIHPDLCGKCNRCIEACPTKALTENSTLNANKCISYWTIETRASPPHELRNKFQDWFFGCDICQDVCPWNNKAFKVTADDYTLNLIELELELKWILESSNHSLNKHFKGTPFLRTGAIGLKKNAILTAGHRRLNNLEADIRKYKDHKILGEISIWALSQFASSDSLNSNG